MTTTYEILTSVRLTGRIANTELELVTKRDNTEVIEALDIKSDILPVRVECHDFIDVDGTPWVFVESGSWQRNGTMVWTELPTYKDGDAYDPLVVSARPQHAPAATSDKPKQIYIKLKPVVDGPDHS